MCSDWTGQECAAVIKYELGSWTFEASQRQMRWRSAEIFESVVIDRQVNQRSKSRMSVPTG